MNYLMLADVSIGSGSGLIDHGIHLLLMILAGAVLYAIGWWFFKDPPLPPIVLKVWKGLFVLFGGILLIDFLLSLGGKGFIHW